MSPPGAVGLLPERSDTTCLHSAAREDGARAHVEKECQMRWKRSQEDGMATVHVRREEGNTWAIMLFWFTFFWFVDFSFSNTLPATEKTKQGTTD